MQVDVDARAAKIKKGEVSLGTSIMACAFKDGVVIGADSRTTMGSYIANRVTDKLTQIHDRVFCCRSGSAADTQAVADIVRYYCQMYTMQHGDTPPSVHDVAVLFESICYTNKDSLSAGIIVAGWDPSGPSVYNIPLGGGLHQGAWTVGGSGTTFMMGYCDSHYEPGWDQQQTMDFVRNSLAIAMSRDGSSGGTIRMAVITERGVERVFVPNPELPSFGGNSMGSAGVRPPR